MSTLATLVHAYGFLYSVGTPVSLYAAVRTDWLDSSSGPISTNSPVVCMDVQAVTVCQQSALAFSTRPANPFIPGCLSKCVSAGTEEEKGPEGRFTEERSSTRAPVGPHDERVRGWTALRLDEEVVSEERVENARLLRRTRADVPTPHARRQRAVPARQRVYLVSIWSRARGERRERSERQEQQARCTARLHCHGRDAPLSGGDDQLHLTCQTGLDRPGAAQLHLRSTGSMSSILPQPVMSVHGNERRYLKQPGMYCPLNKCTRGRQTALRTSTQLHNVSCTQHLSIVR
jgi:hypothetical protein